MLRERWWVVVAVALVVTGTAALFDHRIPNGTKNSAEVSVAPAGIRAPLVGVRPLKPPTPAELNGRVGLLVIEPDVRARVAKRLKGTGFAALPPRISPSSVIGWFKVTVLATDARYSTRVANAWAAVLADEISKQDRRQIDEVIRSFRSQRRDVRRRDPLRSRYQLETQIARLTILRRVGKTAEVVRPAREADADEISLSERTPGSALFGLSLGLVLAFLWDALSRRPRVPARLAAESGLLLAATLPRRANEGDFDRVRASVAQLLEEGGSGTIVVTSAGHDDGCAELAAGLVRALARASDERTVVEAPGLLISADALEAARDAAVVLVAARAGRSSIDELARVAVALDRLRGVPAGLVATGARRDARPAGGYVRDAAEAEQVAA